MIENKRIFLRVFPSISQKPKWKGYIHKNILFRMQNHRVVFSPERYLFFAQVWGLLCNLSQLTTIDHRTDVRSTQSSYWRIPSPHLNPLH